MKMFWLSILVPACAVVVGAQRAEAQYVNPYAPLQQPTVSPYLGLLRQGSGVGLNYYTIVQPQMQLRNDINRQQDQTQRLADQADHFQQMLVNPYTQPGANTLTGASRSIRPTGHATALMSLGGRFLSRTSGASGATSPAYSRPGVSPTLGPALNPLAGTANPYGEVPTATGIANQYSHGY